MFTPFSKSSAIFSSAFIFSQGLFDQTFHPEYLYDIAFFSLTIWTLEVLALVACFYVTGYFGSMKVWDIVSTVGYKFVHLASNMAVMVLGLDLYVPGSSYLFFAYFSSMAGLSTFVILLLVVRKSDSSGLLSPAHQRSSSSLTGSVGKLIVLGTSVTQMLTFWLLKPSAKRVERL